MPELVPVDTDMIMAAAEMANETYGIFRDHQGHYDNTVNNHLVGKVGELACVQWATSLGLTCDQAFRDVNRTDEADLILNLGARGELRIEIKAWSSHTWTQLGRCVSVGQMQRIRVRAHVIVWCIVTPLPDLLQRNTGEVQIAGWNTTAEVAQTLPIWTGPIGGRQVHNHQVPVEQMRPLDDLVAIVRLEA